METVRNYVAVKIGAGKKLHPAFYDSKPLPNGGRGYPIGGLIFMCRCPGTQQGAAANRAKICGHSDAATCKG